MDPNAALATLRALTADALNGKEVDVMELAESFEALDQWIGKGGFLPDAWQRS
jgi:hypothetical protein